MIEELIKAALVKQAERAPHPAPVLYALRNRRRVRPALVALIGACVVVTAIAVPAAFRTTATPVPPATRYFYSPEPPPSVIPMMFKVTDVPAGYVAAMREVNLISHKQIQTWMSGNWAIHMTFNSPRMIEWPQAHRPAGESVQIGGLAGWLWSSGTLAEVTWIVHVDAAITVQANGPNAREMVKRVADSVRPDEVSVIRPALAFGTIPKDLSGITVQDNGNGENWLRAGDGDSTVTARIVPGGTTRPDGFNVVKPLNDGREVEVRHTAGSGLTDQEVREIADGIKVMP